MHIVKPVNYKKPKLYKLKQNEINESAITENLNC